MQAFALVGRSCVRYPRLGGSGADGLAVEKSIERADRLRSAIAAVADGPDAGGASLSRLGVSKFRIDLGIVYPDRPGDYLIGVECDGASYHSAATARDRDKVRAAILEGLGWTLVRIAARRKRAETP